EGDREELFAPEAARRRLRGLQEAGAEPALEVSLTTLAALVGAPASASADIVSLVCVQVSRWAEGRGCWGTAMAFAQAAALAMPLDPEPALFAGTLALRWRSSARAETWLRRAIGLGRRAKDWATYAQAYVEMGRLYSRRGQPVMADRFFEKGWRAARRHGLIGPRGEALHGRLLLALQAGALEAAGEFARGAVRAYGKSFPRPPELMHDVAYLWVREGKYSRAIPTLRKLLPARLEPVERALTWAILARAAAGDGRRELYEEAWLEALAIIRQRPADGEKHLPALVEMAHASALFRDWSHAKQAVQLAMSLATPQTNRALAAQLQQLADENRRRRGG
ncbi:MAG TPA: hypothetical protein VF771_08865, partial [Longimicrobiaceae bacterium]